MFYNEVIYLFLTILIWGAWPVKTGLPLSTSLLGFILKDVLWIILIRHLFSTAKDPATFSARMHGLLKWALLFLFADVSLLSLSAHFSEEIWGILVYLHYLVVGWYVAAKYERRFYLIGLSTLSYISSQLRLFLPALIPWFLAYAADLLFREAHKGYEGVLFWPLFLLLLGIVFPYLAVRLWPTRPFPESSIKEEILGYLKREGVKVRSIYLWLPFEGRLLTAGIMGLVAPFRYLLISPGLLSVLTEWELLSVVAHEAGHIKNRHMFFLFTFLLFFIAFLYFGIEPLWLFFLSLFPYPELFLSEELKLRIWPEVLLVIFIGIAVVVYLRYLMGFFLRNFEREADLYAIESLGSADGIISSLEKIAQLSGLKRAPSWHHYSIEERIEFLKRASEDLSLIKSQHRKVKGALLCFWLMGLIVTFGGYFLRDTLKAEAFKNLYRGLEKRAEEDPQLLRALADHLYSIELEEEALRVYEKTLKRFPEAEKDPWLLNNMAWLLLTASKKELRDPKRALELALKAAYLKISPEILDTLAEAYRQNGLPEEACFYAKKALILAKKASVSNLSYYERRKNGFCLGK